MQYILYSIIFIYSIPLLAIFFSILNSSFFTLHKSSVLIIAFIAKTHFVYLRDVFSSILVPLVTAYSLSKITSDKIIPKQTKILFTVLIIIFIISIFSHGSILYSEPEFNNRIYDHVTFDNYSNITLYYSKEVLAYIALTLGISLKK